MSVIGRLDEQVEAVLIAPLDRNRQPTAEAQAEVPPADEQAKPAPRNVKPPDEDEHTQSAPDEREEMPVWLL